MSDMFENYRRQSPGATPGAAAATPPPAAGAAPTPPAPASSGMQQAQGFSYEILYPGSNAMLRLKLPAGGRFKAESGAMAAMSANIEVEGKLEGGLLGGLGRMLSGENFFFQTLHAKGSEGEVLLAPAALGTLQAIEMEGTSYMLQKGGFFAASEGIQVNTTMQNLAKGIFSGQGFFVLKVSGRGLLFISSYGMIHPIDIPAGQELILDNQHLVAWPEHANFAIETATKGWISSITSGEGLVCRFRGPARVYMQTRNPDAFASWVRGIANAGGKPA